MCWVVGGSYDRDVTKNPLHPLSRASTAALLGRARNLAIGLFLGFLGVSSVAISWLAHWNTQRIIISNMYALVCLVVVIVLASYHHNLWSQPNRYLWIGAAIGTIGFAGPWFVLAAFAASIKQGLGQRKWVALLTTGVTIVICVLRDVYPPGPSASLLRSAIGLRDSVEPISPVIIGSAVLVPLAVAIAVGQFAKLRSQTVMAEARTAKLDTEIARKTEHELIAREIHDVLGHRLSLINLQAGALESTSPDDPMFAQNVQALRDNASKSMADLRSILNVIGAESRPVDLAQLTQIVDDSAGVNQLVNSSVYLRSAEDASDELARAVVRIVQEILTNARKHAPGHVLTLRVYGGPDEGIQITGKNRVDAELLQGVDSRGIVGMEERAKSVGGTLEAGVESGEFIVRAKLPWK